MVDKLSWLCGAGERLRTLTKNPIGDPCILVAVIHGDAGAGGPGDYLFDLVSDLGEGCVTLVGLIRPGYSDKTGHFSTGENFGRRDLYTERNVDVIADALQRLKSYYNPAHFIVLGHSGGAAIAAIVLCRHADLIDTAILISCPCNVPVWRQDRDAWPNSLSPHSFIRGAGKRAKIVALVGENDTNTPPRLSVDYVRSLRNMGVHAEYRIIPEASHSARQIVRSNEFAKIITTYVRARSNK